MREVCAVPCDEKAAMLPSVRVAVCARPGINGHDSSVPFRIISSVALFPRSGFAQWRGNPPRLALPEILIVVIADSVPVVEHL